MKYELIYYVAGKTAESEKRLSKLLSPLGLEENNATAATTKAELIKALSDCVTKSKLIIILGGLDNGDESTDKVISEILKSGAEIKTNKIVNKDGKDGYIIQSPEQILILLSDNPNQIEAMMSETIIDILCSSFSLTKPKDNTPPIEKITDELDEDLQKITRTRLVSAPPKPKLYKRSKGAKLAIRICCGIGCALAVVALTLCAVYYIMPMFYGL